MKLNMDSIQFESRYEIGYIIQALEEWKSKHPNDDKLDTVQELLDKLDLMSMTW